MDDIASRLAALDACALSDAADSLGCELAILPLDPLTSRNRVAGRVRTVLLGPPPEDRAKRHLGAQVLETAQPGDIIVVAGGRDDMGGWGGLLSRVAVQRRVAAAIVDGACRDVDEVSALGFGVWARRPTPRSSRGRLAEIASDVALTIDGFRIEPGDYALADASGVVVAPRARIEQLIAAAEEIARWEEDVVQSIAEGAAPLDVLGSRYEQRLVRRSE